LDSLLVYLTVLANTSKVVPLLSYTLYREDLLESGGIDPLIFNLDIRLRCVVGSMLQRKYSAHGLGGWVGFRTGVENVERHQSHTVLENKCQFPSPAHSLFTTMAHFHFVLGCLFGNVILPMGPIEFIRVRCKKGTCMIFFYIQA
jgi:hypothetical protein